MRISLLAMKPPPHCDRYRDGPVAEIMKSSNLKEESKMQIPGFTAELALQRRGTIAFWGVRPAGSTLAEISPQLFISTHAPICDWPCRVNAQGHCVCPF